MNIQKELRSLLEIIDEKTDGVGFTYSERSVVSSTLLDVAFDHAKSINLLIENQIFGSVFALIRPLFETYIRATWFAHCATDNEIKNFINNDEIKIDGKNKTYFSDLVEAVDKATGNHKILSEIKKIFWGPLSSYTHGGQLHVTRRFDGTHVTPSHDPEQIEEIIRFTALISVLILSEVADVTQNSELGNLAETKANEAVAWCFNKSLQPNANASAE